jgi:alkylhydroperoxidase family enzyme
MPRIAIPANYEQAPLAYAVQHMAPELTGPLYALSKASYKHSILSLREFEGVRARIAQINGCQICQKFRGAQDVPTYLEGLGEDASTAVNTHGPAPDENFYLNVDDAANSPIYSTREKLAIEFAERFSLEPDALGYDDAFWARMKAHFSDAEIYDMTIVTGCFVASGRFVHILGFDQASCSLAEALPKVAAEAAE